VICVRKSQKGQENPDLGGVDLGCEFRADFFQIRAASAKFFQELLSSVYIGVIMSITGLQNSYALRSTPTSSVAGPRLFINETMAWVVIDDLESDCAPCSVSHSRRTNMTHDARQSSYDVSRPWASSEGVVVSRSLETILETSAGAKIACRSWTCERSGFHRTTNSLAGVNKPFSGVRFLRPRQHLTPETS
jgi:hypothetical protein